MASGTRTSSVSQNASTLQMYAKVKGTELAAESYGDMLCIPCYNNTTKQIGFWEAAHFTAKNVAVTGVTLDKSEVSITVGKTATLTATITPSNATNKNVSWTSSDEGVATVENGVVTAVAEGSATITVTTEDGKYSASCEVTVSAASTGYTALFGSNYNSKGISSYSSSWSATYDDFTVDLVNWNNNNNGWNYIKAGSKNAASVATITTKAAISEAITKVVITIDAVTASSINSITLYCCDSADACTTSLGTFSIATGEQSVTISSPTSKKFYKISADCKKSSNGTLTVSKVVYTKE